jgi:hypothetical protein
MICATQRSIIVHVANKLKSMVKTILDDMIGRFVWMLTANVFIDWAVGHLQLFENGYLHGDISIGNALV